MGKSGFSFVKSGELWFAYLYLGQIQADIGRYM